MREFISTRTGRRFLLLVAGVLVAGSAASYLVGMRHGRSQAPGTAEDEQTFLTAKGPWGLIHYWNTVLEMPEEMASISAPQPVTWYFGLASLDEVSRVLRDCGMAEEAAAQLMPTAREVTGGGFALLPDDRSVIGLPPTVRAKLYAVLGRWPLNPTLHDPARFRKTGKVDWLDHTELAQETTALVSRLIYRRGGAEFFGDYEVVLRHVTNRTEATDFLRVMTRRDCIMGDLVVEPEDNLEDLVRYWGRGGRERDVRTLVEAAALPGSRHTIGLRSLMSNFVRNRLYRYRNDLDPAQVNCHYSALNFFNDLPVEAFTNLETCAKTIASDYAPVIGSSYQLGDLVLLVRDGNDAVHSCNVVAGDIVFTKNGNSKGQPWILTTLDEVVAAFSTDQPVAVRVMRRKDPTGF
jgi:hypothetical protein